MIKESASGGLYSLAEVDNFFRRPAAYPNKNAGLMYAEPASVVTYIIEIHGKERLIQALTDMGGGNTADEAFQAALGMNQSALEKAWLRSLQQWD